MELIQQTIRPLAPFAHLAGRTVTTKPPLALRKMLRTPEQLTISQWAERYRRVTEIDAKPGRWRNEMVPHTVPIMDSIGQPWVRQVWICLPERGAKTQILLNTVCWGIDQGSQSGNIFWLMPTEHDARKAMGERVIPVFRAKDDHGRPGRIARYLSEKQDDTSRGTIRFNHGVRLFPAWANSPGSMAAYFGRINIADECDKFPARTSEGTDPITLFLKRARDDRHRSKYVFASTPAGRFIHRGTWACRQVRTWDMHCPDCGEYVQPGEDHIVIPEGTTPENAVHVDVQLACPSCGALWDENARASAYRSGRERIIQGADNSRPESIGWWAPAWVFPTVPMTEIAAAKLRAESGDFSDKSAWANGYLVADYAEEVTSKPELAGLMDRVENYAPVVPMEAGVLTAGVDVQADRLEIEVVAWGVSGESWGMEYRQLWGDTSLPEVWDQLDTYLMQRWRHECGEELGLDRVFVDSGFRSHMVYRFCAPRLSRGVFAIKGAKDHLAPEIGGPIRQKLGGVRVLQYSLGTQRIKTVMFGYFGLNTPGPGYCHIPESYPPAWFAMLDTEQQVTRKVGMKEIRIWELVKSGLRNEAIDLRVYALAAMLSLRIDIKERIRRFKAIAAETIQPERQPTPIEQVMKNRRPGGKQGFVNSWKRGR